MEYFIFFIGNLQTCLNYSWNIFLCFCYSIIHENSYGYNIFTISYKWLIDIGSKLNLLLKLFFYPINNNSKQLAWSGLLHQSPSLSEHFFFFFVKCQSKLWVIVHFVLFIVIKNILLFKIHWFTPQKNICFVSFLFNYYLGVGLSVHTPEPR